MQDSVVALGTISASDPAGSAGESLSAASVVQVHVDALAPGRYQPRQRLSQEALTELADSIREQGVLQPLVVRPRAGEDHEPAAYEIVAGERRWQAAKIAGVATVPVIVRELDDQSALAVALIENLQREDLNPIDQARSLSRLVEEFGLTHEQVAKAVGRSRAAVTNLMRLLELEDEVKELLAQGDIDMGHARALLPLDAPRQIAMARKTARRRLSVRQVEQSVRRLLASPGGSDGPKHDVDFQTRWLAQQFAQELGRRLTIRPTKEGGYTLNVGFENLWELQSTLEHVQKLIVRVLDAAGPRARDADK